MKRFMVIGGEFEDTTFKKLVPGTEEKYGPFKDYGEAYKVWEGKTRFRVDTCCHRLYIAEA